MKYLKSKRARLLASVLLLFILSMFSSCATSRHPRNHSWMDLKHSRELDQKKGKQLKKHQKNVTKRYDY